MLSWHHGLSWGAPYVLTKVSSFKVRYLLWHFDGLFKSYLRPKAKSKTLIKVSGYTLISILHHTFCDHRAYNLAFQVLRHSSLNGYYDISLADRKEFDARGIFAEKDASFNFSSVFGRYPRKMALHNGSITPRYVRIWYLMSSKQEAKGRIYYNAIIPRGFSNPMIT